MTGIDVHEEPSVSQVLGTIAIGPGHTSSERLQEVQGMVRGIVEAAGHFPVSVAIFITEDNVFYLPLIAESDVDRTLIYEQMLPDLLTRREVRELYLALSPKDHVAFPDDVLVVCQFLQGLVKAWTSDTGTAWQERDLTKSGSPRLALVQHHFSKPEGYA